MIDLSWLQSMAPALLAADRVVIVHGMQPEMARGMVASVFGARASARVSIVSPRTPKYGTVHAKAMLTFCGTAGCRMLVHTANDIAQDWMQRCQGGWQRDFPQKPDGGASEGGAAGCEFEDMLVHYLSAVGAAGGEAGAVMQRLVIPEVRKYDFSGAGCALVASVPGRHGHREASPASRNRYGLWRLRDVLEREDIDDSVPASVVMQFSSLGSIHENYLNKDLKGALFACKSRRSMRAETAAGFVKGSDTLQLVLPTLSEVANSNESMAAGGSLPVRAANVHREHISELLHKWSAASSQRGGAMPHIKTIVRYRREQPERIEWMYLGSANLSGAAWGRPRKGKAKNDLAEYLDVWSFELGIALIPSRYKPPSFAIGLMSFSQPILPKRTGTRYCFQSLPAFQGRRNKLSASTTSADVVVPLPIPYLLPPVKYTEEDVPWHIDIGEHGCRGRWQSRCAAAMRKSQPP